MFFRPKPIKITMSDIKTLHEIEQFEADQLEINKKLDAFKATLPDLQKEALTRTQEYMAWMENNKIPAITFVKLFEKGFHQFNTLVEPENLDKYAIDFMKKAASTVWSANYAMSMLMSGSRRTLRVIICDPDTKERFIDTHPPECDL